MSEVAPKKTRLWVRIVRSGAVVIALPLLMLSLLQNRLLYFPERGLPPVPTKPAGVERVELTAADGVKLVSWFLPPQPGRPTLLYFQGNAGNIADRGDRLHDAHEQGWGMLLLGYRGYGDSDGSPDEPGLYADARAALAWLRGRKDVDAKKLVYYGESLGCAPALELAVAEPPGAVVCEAPFASLKKIADFHYWWLPTSLLVRSRFDNVGNAAKLTCPLFVAHGKRDEVIPFEQGRAVFEAARGPKEFFESDARHNDISERGGKEYRARVADFVRKSLQDRDP
jgi:hypothetical protein